MPRCRSKIMQWTNSYSTNCPLSTALLTRITLSTQRLASFLIHSPSNSPHIFTSYQISGTPAPKRTKEISCFTCLNLLIQNRFFFFNIHLRVIIIRSTITSASPPGSSIGINIITTFIRQIYTVPAPS